MASYDAATEIKTRLSAQWALVNPTVPVYDWEDTNALIGATLDPYMVLEFPGGTGQQASIGDPGNNWWKEIGTFQLHCYYPVGNSADTARQYLKDAAAIFRGVSENGIIYRAPFPPSPGRKDSIDGNWLSLSMSVPYEYRILA